MPRSIDAYLNTLSRMEEDISLVDRDAALASIAISMKRAADSLQSLIELVKKLELDVSVDLVGPR